MDTFRFPPVPLKRPIVDMARHSPATVGHRREGTAIQRVSLFIYAGLVESEATGDLVKTPVTLG